MISAIASRPAEAVLEELLEDDRALIRLSAYETSFHEEVAWIATAPLSVYTMLAVVAQAPGWAQELRSLCLECADVQMAYIEKHFLSIVRSRPFSLALGCIHRNLDELAATDQVPLEEITAQIWQLMRLEANRVELADAITELLLHG